MESVWPLNEHKSRRWKLESRTPRQVLGRTLSGEAAFHRRANEEKDVATVRSQGRGPDGGTSTWESGMATEQKGHCV